MMPKWLKWTLALVGGPAAMFALEILLQIQWLGRPNWPIGRMWTNLILVSILAILALELVQLVFETSKGATGCLASLSAAIVYIYVCSRVFDAVFKNPAINWPTPVCLSYIAGLIVITIPYILWGVDQIRKRESPSS